MSPAPSVGRIVHYVSRGSADGVFEPTCRAAVITEVCMAADMPTGSGSADTEPVRDEAVSLAVLNPTGLFFDGCLLHDEDGKAAGTWHWPERTD